MGRVKTKIHYAINHFYDLQWMKNVVTYIVT